MTESGVPTRAQMSLIRSVPKIPNRREPLQIEHLCALCVQCLEQAALAGARGAADHLEGEPLRQGLQLGDDRSPVGLVAAVQLPGRPAHLAQHVGHCAAAIAAAPTVDERPPALRLAGKHGIEMRGDVARHQRRADLARLEGRNLLVDRADPRPLFVGEHGAAYRARHVVLRVFGRRTHVDEIVKFRELCYGREARDARARRVGVGRAIRFRVQCNSLGHETICICDSFPGQRTLNPVAIISRALLEHGSHSLDATFPRRRLRL